MQNLLMAHTQLVVNVLDTLTHGFIFLRTANTSVEYQRTHDGCSLWALLPVEAPRPGGCLGSSHGTCQHQLFLIAR